VFLPFLSDPTPSGARGATVEADTTYADDRFVGLVPGVWNIVAGESLFVPDPDSVGAGVAYRAVMLDPDSDFIVISYDTLVVAALDSAVVDSIWAANSIGTPYAYVVDVPGGTGLAYGDLGTIFELTVEDSTKLASLVGYAYLDTMPFKAYSRIAAFDSLFEGWSEFWWDDWTGDSLGMSQWWDHPGVNNQLVDSLAGCYYTYNYHNYYDRVYNHLSYWWRTGDTSYVRKANSYANIYAACLRASTEQPRDNIPDGLVMRWIMSKDTLDLKALTKETRFMEEYFARRKYWGDAITCATCDDARVQGRVYTSIILADEFNYPDSAAYASTWADAHTYATDSMWQWVHVGSDSAYQSGFFPLASYCDAMVGWQMGTQWSHSMIREWEFGATAARQDSIETILTRLADTLWTLGWIGVDPVGKAARDSFNFLYGVGMDTTSNKATLHHRDTDSTAAWYWKYYDASHTKAPTAGVAVDSFWQKHIYYRDNNNGGHDSLPVFTRAIDLSCHFSDTVAAHTVYSGHVLEPYKPEATLTGMVAPIYAFVWKVTGDSTYWYMADTLIAGMIYGEKRADAATWPYLGGKLYNEAYYQTPRAIKWLDEGP